MTVIKYPEIAKKVVLDWYIERGINELTIDDVYIVWFAKTLQNWKALVSTTVQDTRYFEVTFNGVTNEIYLDAYVKEENKVLKYHD